MQAHSSSTLTRIPPSAFAGGWLLANPANAPSRATLVPGAPQQPYPGGLRLFREVDAFGVSCAHRLSLPQLHTNPHFAPNREFTCTKRGPIIGRRCDASMPSLVLRCHIRRPISDGMKSYANDWMKTHLGHAQLSTTVLFMSWEEHHQPCVP
ncbi:hypothetical protein BDV95DRAFT_116140 [Massariosphaeria phaeospora]|uniref:Uncharacterized protein n=1 Tax=Massariosphaeria phaeospora TaxID=100035 RepID=A0A7C8M4T9_9PLEO|nr:hypothetical protein BDV95DRAFT_116140 [Massariosphaeria phaeospora]